jgi:hypothetical protein
VDIGLLAVKKAMDEILNRLKFKSWSTHPGIIHATRHFKSGKHIEIAYQVQGTQITVYRGIGGIGKAKLDRLDIVPIMHKGQVLSGDHNPILTKDYNLADPTVFQQIEFFIDKGRERVV